MVDEPKHTVFFSAAEASADHHCARLIEAMRAKLGPVRFLGLGGDAMAGAGCELLANLPERAAMLTHALGQVGYYHRLRKDVKEVLAAERPGLVVVCDSPAWNFHVAKAAKKLGIPVLFYVAPQLWAWGAWRAGKLRRSADHVACILPFEAAWFEERGVKATFVGHPLFDEADPMVGPDPFLQASREFPTVALLPGSRGHEIHHLWPVQQEVAVAIRKRYPNARFLASTHTEANATWLREHMRAGLEVEVRRTGIEAAVRHADLAVVASGTATLQVAMQHCPMIVMYHVPRWQWKLVGRWLVKTEHLSLVNILAGWELAPEYMPLPRDPEVVAGKALEFLGDEEKRGQMRQALRELVKGLAGPGAAATTAELAQGLLGRY